MQVFPPYPFGGSRPLPILEPSVNKDDRSVFLTNSPSSTQKRKTYLLTDSLTRSVPPPCENTIKTNTKPSFEVQKRRVFMITNKDYIHIQVRRHLA